MVNELKKKFKLRKDVFYKINSTRIKMSLTIINLEYNNLITYIYIYILKKIKNKIEKKNIIYCSYFVDDYYFRKKKQTHTLFSYFISIYRL